ncbi:glutamyl-tRNA reductase [Azospirillum humicireducens]|uniref:Glutamyl-tRNA reductase n=1 Tax=Azospirillum humicireducens TaxID=1226968 RepID=A0A160JHH3_9PROT|nr:glutamyl-tRNA reductase [Azospirillum humicireducens]ANC92460.1 glutamyl-tRNA reductase [Azospirillum humicireducens]
MTTTSYLVIGASHRTCSGAVRDRLSTDEAEVAGMLDRLRAAGVGQAVWLSTCDRVEVQAVHERPNEAALAIAEAMADRVGLPTADLAPQLYTRTGIDAVRHLFAVACSLDSQIVGEPHILGQVKAAHRSAASAGMTGPELEAVLQAAYAAAKRVRSETPIAEGATSLAAAAIQVARDLHGDIRRCGALLLGLGDMGALVLEGLREAGLPRLTVAAPVDRRAEAAARRLDGHFAPWADLETAMTGADILVAAAGLGRYILTAPMMEAVLKRRRRRPVFVVDAAIPADVDPAVARMDGAFVYDLGDLERVALQGRVGREAATQAAWMIVDEAVSAFARDRAERAAVPAVAALRTHFEAERRRLLSGHGDLDAASATRLLVNRLLHVPSEALRALAADGSGEGLAERAAAERLMFRLFGLDRFGRDGMACDGAEETERDKDERREPGREVR